MSFPSTRPLRRRPLSADEYRAMPESMIKCSLIDGVLVEEPSASYEHQTIVINILLPLGQFVRKAGLGWVQTAPLDVWVTEQEVVQPDVFFVSNGRRSIIQKNGIHGAPDLVVEVLSPSTRSWDRHTKRERYARRGVAELWLVDSDSRRVEIHRFAECRHGPLRTLSSAETLETPLLPGFRLPVWQVFERDARG